MYREQRLEKLEKIKSKRNPYPNDFKPKNLSQSLTKEFANTHAEKLEAHKKSYSLAGRVMAVRSFGKSAFLSLKDRSGKIQIYIGDKFLKEDDFQEFLLLDIGDIIAVTGSLFKTKTGELSLKADSFRILVKSLLPLPEKFHGLTDIELRYRERYVDLIMNPKVEEIFKIRSQCISFIRDFFIQRNYLEVETPMMQPLCGGAEARPFKTHHNALNMELYLRIAPELYLKRLVVGGLERVFELNRNFRNEGISMKHNPEFTMLEFYEAYATYEDFMNLTEDLISSLVNKVHGSFKLDYQDQKIDLTPPFKRFTVREALKNTAKVPDAVLNNHDEALKYATQNKIPLCSENPSLGDILMDIFDELVEDKLVQPTFVTEYPLDVSPLSRRNEKNPQFVDRFELYISKNEIANAFSELNDPQDQKQRFLKQVQEKREGVAAVDEDYVRALEYGLPPTAGEGIGIDRLVMLLTNSHNIREVILFPLLRPE